MLKIKQKAFRGSNLVQINEIMPNDVKKITGKLLFNALIGLFYSFNRLMSNIDRFYLFSPNYSTSTLTDKAVSSFEASRGQGCILSMRSRPTSIGKRPLGMSSWPSSIGQRPGSVGSCGSLRQGRGQNHGNHCQKHNLNGWEVIIFLFPFLSVCITINVSKFLMFLGKIQNTVF